MSEPVKCPYCKSTQIHKTKFEKYLGIALKVASTVGEIYARYNKSRNYAGLLVQKEDVSEFLGTDFICENCKKEFTLRRDYRSSEDRSVIVCLDENAPDNLERKKAYETGKYKCTVHSLDLSSWWKRDMIKCEFKNRLGISTAEYKQLISHLPVTVKFYSELELELFMKGLEQEGCVVKRI